MWWIDDFIKDSNEIESLTKDFIISLRTSFSSNNPQNYITIQRVNIECEVLKNKVRKILNTQMLPQNKKLKAQQLAESAMFYIQKFEQAKERWILLDGDILYKLWQNLK